MDSQALWHPTGLPPAFAVRVGRGQEVSRSLYLMLLQNLLQRLIDTNPTVARNAMEISADAAPELWAVAARSPRSDWASELVRSDSLGARLPREWSGTFVDDPGPPNLIAILEHLA